MFYHYSDYYNDMGATGTCVTYIYIRFHGAVITYM